MQSRRLGCGHLSAWGLGCVQGIMTDQKTEKSIARKGNSVQISPLMRLRILATSDLHANLLAWDYHANRVCPARGLSRLSRLIETARTEQPQSLLLDNGDFLHGTALGEYVATAAETSGKPQRRHPVIMAMNHLRYDAATLGNHEFSHGMAFLRQSLAAARFPIVCSNLCFKPSRGKPLALPYVVLQRRCLDEAGNPHLLRIAVVGFLPPQTVIWEQRNLNDRVSVDDIVTSARVLVPDLRKEGVDLIIALSHSGIGADDGGNGAENASQALAAVDGIDAVIAGHTHLVFPSIDQTTLHGKPAVMPGFFGSHLGVIDLELRRKGRRWVVAGHHSETRAISQRNPQTGTILPLVDDDPAIVALAMPVHTALQTGAAAVIGHTSQPLHSYFALLSDTPALTLVAQSQMHWLRRALENTDHADLPVLAAVAPFKAGGRGGPENYTYVPAGPLLTRHVSDLYVHPNSLVGLRVTGDDLALWLERSVSLYRRILPGPQDQTLIDEDFPSFNFDMIYGLYYRVDLSQPARFDARGRDVNPKARRITDLCHFGRPVLRDQLFALATNSYRSAGGAGFAATTPAHVIYSGQECNRVILRAHIAGGAMASGQTMHDWGFVPMPGVSVVFESAPQAADHMQDVPHLQIEPLAWQPSGFRRFRLHL